jgi:dTDP-glucose 4,6-dehydratase
MRHILVTGGAGFIGSNFIRYLLDEVQAVEVINLDALTYAGSLTNLQDLPDPSRQHFVEGDICDQALVRQLFETYSFDTVIHFAAESHVDRSILGPEKFIQTNVIGTYTLLEACREYWLEDDSERKSDFRFHHVSTDEVYGSLGPDEPAFSETTSYAPNSPYAASKASSDHLVRAYHHTYGLNVTVTNCSNNYGPYQFPEKLIPLMIMNALQGLKLPIYGDGQQIRDWLYVIDHCRAVWKVVEEGSTGETYNIGGDNQPTNLEIVNSLCEILNEKFPDSPHNPFQDLISHVEDRPGHDRRYAMNINKIEKTLGWEPKVSLHEGLKKTVNWYVEHPEWIQSITDKEEFTDWLTDNYQTRGDQE